MVHLRRLGLTLTMAVLISVTLFLPCVKADIQQTVEFYEPIRNWSFESGSQYWAVGLGYRDNTHVLYGDYSWYTDGGRWVEQSIQGDVINAVKGKSVMFSYWFYPETVAEDGSQNYARAILSYSTEDGISGGGCPYVFVWDGTQYVADNNLLSASEYQNESETDVEDFYRLEHPPKVKQGKYSLLIREFEGEHSYIDQAKLSVVDHKRDINIAVSPSGEILTYGNPARPASAINKEGENITENLREMDGWSYEGYEGDYVTLNFGNLNTSDGAKLLIRSDSGHYKKSPIYIQTLNSTGDWNTVATIYVRKHWSVDIIDLSPYLPSSEELKLRIYFVSKDKIDFVGMDNTEQGKFEVQNADLVSATHSVEGNVKRKLQNSDDEYAELPSGDQIRLEFTVPPTDEDSRDFVLYVNGHYVLHKGNPTAYSDWVYPTELKWYKVHVTATLPSDIDYLGVSVEGSANAFYAWLDVASLNIYTDKSTTSSKGDLSVSASVVRWQEIEDPGWMDGLVRVAVGLYAEGNPYYDSGDPFGLSGARISGIALKVELLPNDGSSTTQNASLDIKYCGQGNNKGIEVDPSKNEEFHNWILSVAELAIGVVVGGALSIACPATAPGLITEIFLTGLSGGVIMFAFQHFASDADDKHADAWDNPNDYFIKEYWGYHPTPSGWGSGSARFVRCASGHYGFEWQFYTWKASSFQIRVTATVYWGYRQTSIRYGVRLVSAGWQTTTTYVTISP